MRQLPMDAATIQQDPMLAEIVRRLVEAYQPERIYLFGSLARGEGGPDSDYDLMVVFPRGMSPGLIGKRRWG
jgi:predicted nucleotidyltransferase